MIMYSSVIPSYNGSKDEGDKKKKEKREVIDMNDPRNEEKLDKLFERFY